MVTLYLSALMVLLGAVTDRSADPRRISNPPRWTCRAASAAKHCSRLRAFAGGYTKPGRSDRSLAVCLPSKVDLPSAAS